MGVSPYPQQQSTQQQGGFGPPQQQPQNPYGAPAPGQGGGYGDPNAAQGYGNPGMPQGYGQPAQVGMAPANAGGGFMAAAQQGMAMATQGGTRPTTRNPVMTILLPYGCFLAGILVTIIFGILAGVTNTPAIAMVGSLVSLLAYLAGAVLSIMSMIKMIAEVKSVTGNQAFPWWPIIVPFYNFYFFVLPLTQEVANAKRAMNVQEPVRSPVLYFFFVPYALAADINDLAARAR
jgi:hypothetical protein